MIEIFQAGGVISIALHQYQLRIDGNNGMNRPLDIAYVRSARRQNNRFSLMGYSFQGFQPGDIARTDFIGRHIRLQHIDSIEVIGRREIIDTDFITFFFQDRCPLKGNRGVLVNLEN